MAKPFSVQCPNCDARLKIQNPAAVGKKVRCPNCQNPFTVEAPRTRPPKDDFGLDDDYDDDFGGPSDDFEDDYEDDFGPPKSSRRSSASRPSASRSKKSSKTKKKSRKKSNNKTPLLIGGGVVAFLLLVGIGFLVFNAVGGGGGGLDSEDVAWLPPDSQMVVSVDLDKLWDSNLFQRSLNSPEAAQAKAQIEEGMRKLGFAEGETPNVIDHITVGMTDPDGDTGLAVIRKKSAWNLDPIIQEESFQEATHDGKTYYENRRAALYQVDENVLLVGQIETVKQAMTRGPTSTDVAKKFSFLPKGQIVMGFLPSNLEELRKGTKELETNPGARMFLGSKPYFQPIVDGLKELEGGGLGVTFGSGMEIALAAKCASSSAAGKLSGGVNDALADVRKMITDMTAAIPPDQKEMVDVGLTVFDTLDADSSGDTATLSLEISSGTIDRMEALAKKAGGGRGMPPGFMPKFPGLDFGDLLGGGGGGRIGGPIGDVGEAGTRAQDKNNLKQIGIGLHNYHDTHGAFPGGGGSQLSWRVHILPFIEQGPLYAQFRLNEPWNSPHNMALIPQMPNMYRRPGSTAAPGKTNYVGIAGPGGMMENGGGKRISAVTDGTTDTILVTEVVDHAAVTWTQPIDYHYDANNPMRDLGGFSGGFHALLCDGSVRFLPNTIDPQTLLNLFQIADGNPILDF